MKERDTMEATIGGSASLGDQNMVVGMRSPKAWITAMIPGINSRPDTVVKYLNRA